MNEISIQALPASASDAARLALRLDVPVHGIALHTFPDGEMRVTVGPATPTTVIYASLDQPNDKLIALLFAAEALRRDGCKRLILLAPYLCYMRQDTAFHDGEAISQKAIGRLLAGIVDRVITVDAHLHRTPDIRTVFPGIAAENLSAMPAIADALRKTHLDPATVLIGPDAESRQWVSDLAGRLGLTYTVAQKIRHGDRSVEIGFSDPRLIAGRPALLVDDIVSSGGTLITCARALTAAGATQIDAVVTHALFPADTIAQFTDAGIRSIRSTHSVPHPTNAIVLDELFVAALRDETKGQIRPEIQT
ncbi:ribose-phosphate pyrophosphokinase [Rhodopseudomonas sp. P2A-2r]|uniref:ribose-phosphate pyrophosphokinase n=1 Tax=Rhodopseudomonas sp. P2A-2r TaxID=2991972 RepID=UPI002233ECA4|nr:ribose-phosphate pyrophosphokinase [Rhodopseudomonas sp. P2A-2r]UZE50440.1 ribose-phosphate pyrophosphokinase [Rhodopseudomonas sp. P2A-2r]